MGYHTDFSGQFNLDRPLTPDEANYLFRFNKTRRMRRDPEKTANRSDPVRREVYLPVGDEGCYFVNETGFMGQDEGPDVVGYNEPPAGQPDLWCKWTPANKFGEPFRRGYNFYSDDIKREDRPSSIVWDGNEKFHAYIEWLEYIIKHFLIPWGHNLNGVVQWVGEDLDDIGEIIVTNNIVESYEQ
jgi:hypothetical protein